MVKCLILIPRVKYIIVGKEDEEEGGEEKEEEVKYII